MVFCDGAVRFIRDGIDGTVYSKLITPSGSKLPSSCLQLPLSQDALRNKYHSAAVALGAFRGRRVSRDLAHPGMARLASRGGLLFWCIGVPW